ncbi:uncharacterized protein LOC129720269 [Wyeomyia smithii]|uniref:uncharacterized protein LOC129720269 n=1 Tax=Wyeomyia smithii TaxID=174621 RepID=UPI002467B553|nr:uncharacterized protein LOC129720269 [Wyeomyia smithii]
MGSPLSPILADIVLDSVIERAINELPFSIPFIRKYVDDLILAIPEDASEIVLNTFNRQETRLQFTLEAEEHRRLPFLDLMRARRNNPDREHIVANQPPTNPAAYTAQQHSRSIQHSTKSHQISPSQPSNQASTTAEIENQPKHPHNVQHSNKNHHNIPSQPSNANHQAATTEATASQSPPHQKTTSQPAQDQETPSQPTPHQKSSRQPPPHQETAIQPTPHQKTLIPDYSHITISSRQHNKISRMHTIVKDPIRKEDHSQIIYKIPCNDCNNCYIGMTQNKLCMRISGHKSNVNKMQQILSTNTNTKRELDELKEKTALINHCILYKHNFDFSGTVIVDHSNRTHILPFLEMCHIHNTPNTVNKRVDLDGLNTAYAAVLSSIAPNTNTSAN